MWPSSRSSASRGRRGARPRRPRAAARARRARPARGSRRRRPPASRRGRRRATRGAPAPRAQPPSSVAWMTHGAPAGRTPAFVAKLEPETGTPTAPGRGPRRMRRRPDVEETASVRARASARSSGRLRADERAAVELDDPLDVRRPRRRRAEPRRRRTPRARRWSVGLKRRSKPIVVDAFELIASPQSEPATWPGKTSTPSRSSSRRRRRVEQPFGALAAPDGEIGPRRRRRRRASRR